MLHRDDGVFLSTDNGGIWTAASEWLPDYPRHVYSVAANDSTVFAGTENGVYVSTNNGTSWRSTITGIAGEQRVSPVGFRLEENYPNPFNPMTVVRYQLPVGSCVRLVVFDLLGREVKVLVDEKKAPGSYSVDFNANGLASGVYVCRMTAGRYAESRKMLVLR